MALIEIAEESPIQTLILKTQLFFSENKKLICLLSLLFLLRLGYGLSVNFWNDDEIQIFLLGLEQFTTKTWLFFGPDVVHTSQQIAGALQAVLISSPLFLWAVPESPVVLLNILSVAGLIPLGIYLKKRYPGISPTLLFAWLFTLPWTINYSTHIYNPSYLLFPSCIFFVGFFELMPSLTSQWWSKTVAFFALGFGLSWCTQIHLSWPLLLPFVGFAFLQQILQRSWGLKPIVKPMGAFIAGFSIPAIFLLPTLYSFGPEVFLGPLSSNSKLNYENFIAFPTIMARFLSFASYELSRFVVVDSRLRYDYFMQHFWLLPFGLLVGLFGLVQPVLVLGYLHRRTSGAVFRVLLWFVLLEIWASFLFSSRPPTARNFYILLPIAVLLTLQGSLPLLNKRFGLQVAQILILLNLLYHTALASYHYKEVSLYTQRELVMKAMDQSNYRILGERRYPEIK